MKIDELVEALDNRTAPAADEPAIAGFEQLLEHRLPGDYRAFLARTGGGYCSHSSFAYELGAMAECWNCVGGLRSDADYSLSHHVHDPGFGPLPRHLVWIGDDSSGNPVTLSLRDDRMGEVFIIDHELCAFEGERETIEQAEDYGLAMSAAPSFTAFVALLALVSNAGGRDE